MLTVNDRVPTSIILRDERNQPVHLGQLSGQMFLLYFYPKDNTAVCTLEAQQFRDHQASLKRYGVSVIGVSKDSVESHQKFKQDHRLNFALWSDSDRQLQEAFGVWQEKRMMGKSYMGTVRSSFLINSKGVIVKSWLRVKPKDHIQEIIQTLEELKQKRSAFQSD